MRALFSLVALVAALAVVFVLVKQQMAAVKVPALAVPFAIPGASAPAGQNVRQQLDQLKQDLDEAARQSTRQLENQ